LGFGGFPFFSAALLEGEREEACSPRRKEASCTDAGFGQGRGAGGWCRAFLTRVNNSGGLAVRAVSRIQFGQSARSYFWAGGPTGRPGANHQTGKLARSGLRRFCSTDEGRPVIRIDHCQYMAGKSTVSRLGGALRANVGLSRRGGTTHRKPRWRGRRSIFRGSCSRGDSEKNSARRFVFKRFACNWLGDGRGHRKVMAARRFFATPSAIMIPNSGGRVDSRIQRVRQLRRKMKEKRKRSRSLAARGLQAPSS